MADEKKPTPEYLGRKGKGSMGDEEFRSVVSDALSQSASFVDTELSPDRALATDYYAGKPFGDEEDGRSKVILTEVRDTVDGMLPSIMRVALPPGEHAVEFVPTRADNVEQAAQKTDYVRYVFEQDCSGFLRLMDVVKDGLIRKIGILTWGYDKTETTAYRQEGINQAQLEALAEDDEVELTKVVKLAPTKEQKAELAKQLEAWEAQASQNAQQGPQQPVGSPNAPAAPQLPPKPELEQLYDVELTRTVKNGRAWVDSVPPEEFIFNRNARRLDRAEVLGRRMEKTRGELIAMGISEEDIDAHGSSGDGSTELTISNAEEWARRDVGAFGKNLGSGGSSDPDLGKANNKILYFDGIVKTDFNGDGKWELRRVHTIGPTYYTVKHYPTDEVNFAIFSPHPEPHALLGGSTADRTMDIQRINSAIMRGILDSGAASLFPRITYVEGQASVADIMNNAIGAPIRMRQIGMVTPLAVPFTGKEMLPVLEFMQSVIERRTGRKMGVEGLDSDALQSTGKEAVNAVLTGSQEQVELIVRVLAEMTLKPMFEGIGRMLQRNQPRSRVVRLRGKWVEIDPRQWDANMDVQVNVALGSSHTEKKIALLKEVAADQESMMQQLGLSNPAVTLPMVLNTRRKVLELQGLKDSTNYYAELPADWQPPAPPPQKSPEEMALEAEKQMNQLKTVKELAIKQDELEMEKDQQQWQRGFEMEKHAADVALRKYEIDAQFHGTMTQQQLDAKIADERAHAELTIQAHDQLHDQELERSQHEHEKELATRQQELDAQAPTE